MWRASERQNSTNERQNVEKAIKMCKCELKACLHDFKVFAVIRPGWSSDWNGFGYYSFPIMVQAPLLRMRMTLLLMLQVVPRAMLVLVPRLMQWRWTL